ncbi:MAG TPA: hypothetical protein VMT53_17635 [Terriglobales bacterium]|nr:hypothetical protein [Terriglobales bacterium]
MTIFRQKPNPLLSAFLAICVLLPWSAMAQSNGKGRLEVTVFILDSLGQSYVPGAKAFLSGPAKLQAETDQQGKCVFTDVIPGSYSISVVSPGLEASSRVTVTAGSVTESSLQLKPSAVATVVTVTVDAAGPETKAATLTQQTIAENMVRDAPNANERTESVLPLVPGVVRGPDGRINMKGARSAQSGALVNSANATDPATGNPGLDVPIDVVASVQVISNPFDPQYGKLTGAVSTIDTKTSNFDKFHFSVQNVFPRIRVRGGSIYGIGAATPRMTFTGPLIKDRIAYTQSLEYRYVRTPVNSLPATRRDTTLDAVNSYTQFDFNLNPKQTATISLAVYPQKLKHLGLNTFNPQPSTPDYHQRGYQVYVQHRYVTGDESLLTSQFSYKTFDSDITPLTLNPYRLLVETTEGGFFNIQARRSTRVDWQEIYQFEPRQFWGTHQFKAGINYAHATYDSHQTFLPVEIADVSGMPVEDISFGQPGYANIDQNEFAWFASDQWTPFSRLTVHLGARFDRDSITDSVHTAPRAGFQIALTSDGKTLLKGGWGLFYDRVPLMLPTFPSFPSRTTSYLDPLGQVESSTFYSNRIEGRLHNPRSIAWNAAVSRQVRHDLVVQVAYEWRKTTDDFDVAPLNCVGSCSLVLSNSAQQSYRELQISGRYQFKSNFLNASYVHSRAYGDLNDFFQFFGNSAKPVIQPDGRGRLNFDAPNRGLFWGEFKAPWKLTFLPVYDVHTGFPYSVQDVFREYIGQRNSKRYPRFQALDLQILRAVSIPVRDRHLHTRIGLAIFNLTDHFNPRDVQTISESPRFAHFFNDAWREYRGKFVIEF